MKLYMCHCVFPTTDIEKTANFYRDKLGFVKVDYPDASEPHICLYRDNIEFILTESQDKKVVPNHEMYGYGGDAYIITDNQAALQTEFEEKGVKIVVPLHKTDYHTKNLQ